MENKHTLSHIRFNRKYNHRTLEPLRALLTLIVGVSSLITVYAVQGATYTIVQLTDNELNDEYATINATGQLAWVFAEGTYVHFYNSTSVIQLNPVSGAYMDPKISNNGKVVWSSLRNNGEIFLYNGTITVQLTDNDTIDFGPDINASGQVVWMGIDDSYRHDYEIYLYDGDSTSS
jgi:hypothetical protein